MPPLTWALLIRSLGHGGAERQTVVLARALHERGQRVRVITFYDGGAMAKLLPLEIPVVSLGKKGRWDVWPFVGRLISTLRRDRPDVLYTFLTVPNLIAAALRPLLPDSRLVWGVRSSNMDLIHYDWFARMTARLERAMAKRADLIIANSTAGKTHALSLGFPPERTIVIGNGIDTAIFHRDTNGRARLRREWGIRDDELLVGLAARFDPMKGHETFLRAAAHVAAHRSDVRFACVGGGDINEKTQAQALAATLGIEERVLWLGPREDMPSVYSAFDIACSASRFGEGFSNSIAEAMACETPCVATDVGDSAKILGDTGIVTPPGDANLLAAAILQYADMDSAKRRLIGEAARNRVEEFYSVERLVMQTINAVTEIGCRTGTSEKTL